MSRFENSIDSKDLCKIEEVFVDRFIDSYEKPPKGIILDIDDTDDITYGAQQLQLFNAYHNDYCFMPLFIPDRSNRGSRGKAVNL